YRDTTAREEAASGSRATEERLQLAVENAEIGFWDVDPINDVLIWPPRTKKMFGISPDVPVSMADFYTGLHPEDRELTSAAYAAAADSECRALYDVEYRTIGKEDGVIRWVAAKGRGVFDESGLCIRVAGTAIDITERKASESARERAEARLRDLNETLEQRVAERSLALETAHEQLRQSQKLEAMGSLTGGVAHDFNNLLTPIVGVLDRLQQKQWGNEREQALISGALRSAERAAILVQRLLAFARRQPLKAVAVDVGKLIDDMVELIASTIGPHIKVLTKIEGKLPFAKVDQNQLEMALLNLAVNARDAMAEGGTLQITASAAQLFEDNSQGLKRGSYICLSVADTGVGMDEQTLARAVEPFFSTKGVGKGTGLGLSMVHGLASQLGGAMQMKSTPGHGTSVELWLPVTADAIDVAEPSKGSSLKAGRGAVLLVDDEELVRLTTSETLIDLGYEVVQASSAEQGLGLLRQRPDVELVITDHLMSGMTGIELAHTVKSMRPGLPVLLISGYAEATGVGPDMPRLTKPFRKDALVEMLSSLTTDILPSEKQ
ncbi:MAG: ATP-binding protein, partial [Proteobacteria bacterium]|nr:ATP-binding protein [Pseudomonadota bacterium]